EGDRAGCERGRSTCPARLDESCSFGARAPDAMGGCTDEICGPGAFRPRQRAETRRRKGLRTAGGAMMIIACSDDRAFGCCEARKRTFCVGRVKCRAVRQTIIPFDPRMNVRWTASGRSATNFQGQLIGKFMPEMIWNVGRMNCNPGSRKRA